MTTKLPGAIGKVQIHGCTYDVIELDITQSIELHPQGGGSIASSDLPVNSHHYQTGGAQFREAVDYAHKLRRKRFGSSSAKAASSRWSFLNWFSRK